MQNPNVPFQSFESQTQGIPTQEQLAFYNQQWEQQQQWIPQQYLEQQQWQYNPMMDPQYQIQQLMSIPRPGPYPGITTKEFDDFNVPQQVQFQRFLNDVGNYYQKGLPLYQSKMHEFQMKNQTYLMKDQENLLMSGYTPESNELEQQKDQSNSDLKLNELDPKLAVIQEEVEKPEEKKKERKKMSLKAPVFTQPQPPALPKYPTAPDFINLQSFNNLYTQFLDIFQPTTVFTRYPTMEEQTVKEKKKQERNKQLKIQEENKVYKRIDQPDENRLQGLKEEKINIDDLVIDKAIFIEPDETRQPVNLVFIGHVDAGKSTLCGRILVDLGEITLEDQRKFQQEAKENNRESWWLAYCMDINEEERAKGKTVECGRAQFQTQNKRFTLFDAPGHKNYIPNMIMGACQADLAGLIISAKTGEYESGFEKGGQTQEHALLAKSLGVQHLIVIVTKMDTIDWDKTRFDLIVEAVQKFIASICQFKTIHIIPIDALVGQNCSTPVTLEQAKWYKGPTLMQLIDDIPIPKPNPEGPIRIPVLDKLRDVGLFIFGKVESGTIVDGQNVSLMPKKYPFVIAGIYNTKDQRMKYAKAGENVKIKIKGLETDEIGRGNMICNLESNPCQISVEFQVKIRVLELPEHKRILSEGYTCVLHLHCLVEEVEVSLVEAVFDPETNKPIKQQFLKSNQEGIIKLQLKNPVCLEKCDFIDALGRFALRDEGISIAFGEVLKIKPFQVKKEQALQQ